MRDNSDQNSMLRGNPIKKILRMAGPTTFGLFAIMATDLTDAYFVSLLGTQPLAALGFAFPILMLMISTGIGLSAGVSACTARAIGKNDNSSDRAFANHGLWLAAIIGSILGALILLLHNVIFSTLGASEPIRDMLIAPMVFAILSMVALIITMSGMGALRGRGETGGPGVAMVTVALVNMALDPILIFGLGPIPALGLTGSMVATFVARLTGLAMILYLLHRKNILGGSQQQSFAESTKKLLHVGLPASIANVIIPVGTAVITAIIARYGESAIAGFSVATRLETVFLVPFYALSGVVGPFMGQNYAACKSDRMTQALKQLLYTSLLLGFILMLAIWLLQDILLQQFGAGDHVRDVAKQYLTWLPMAYGAYGVSMIVVASFNGLHQPWSSNKIAIGRSIVTMVPLAFMGSYIGGLGGIWICLAIAHVVWGIIAFFMLRSFISVQSNHEGAQ